MEQKETEVLNPIIGKVLRWYDHWTQHYQNEEKISGQTWTQEIPLWALKQTMLFKDEAGWSKADDLTPAEYDQLAAVLYKKNPVALTDWNLLCQDIFFPDERDNRLRQSVDKLLAEQDNKTGKI